MGNYYTTWCLCIMKFKYFLFFCIVFLVSCIYVIIFERKRPVFVGLVTETHKQIDSLRNFKQDLKEASEKLLNVDQKYLSSLGFIENPLLYPEHYVPNVTLPVIVTYAKSGQEELAVSFVRNIAKLLPHHVTLIYNIGLQTSESFLLQDYCTSNHCSIVNFDLSLYPPHIQKDSSLIRPLIIQDALNKVGSIFFMECNVRLQTAHIEKLISEAKANGIVAWQTKYPTTTITHPKMFEYFKASKENFYFVSAVQSSKLLIFNTKNVHDSIMYPWIKCVLVRNCILPIGAQNSGCQFNKKPLYRYSSCHFTDASALSIVLGQFFNYNSETYSRVDDPSIFLDISADDATLEISLLVQNRTDKINGVSKWIL